MEGWVMKKSWLENWKKRYLACDQNEVFISKSIGDDSRKRYSIKGCQVKQIQEQRFNLTNVFSLKCEDEKFYFCVENQDEYERWILFFKQFVQRPSLLEKNPKDTSKSSKRISIQTYTGFQQKDVVFDSHEIIVNIDNLIKTHYCQQCEINFSQLCSKFLGIVVEHIEEHISSRNKNIESLGGIKFQEIHDQEERRKLLKNMKSKIFILRQNIKGIYIPLECVIDCYNGKSYYAISEIKKTNDKIKNRTINELNQSKLTLLKIMLGLSESLDNKIEYTEDCNGNLWILNSSCLLNSEVKNDTQVFVDELDKGKLFIYDSPSLLQAMKFYEIPFSKLGKIYLQVKNNWNKILILNEIISQSCKELFQEILSEDSSKESITKFFNDILGNSKESDKPIKIKLYQNISKLYHIDLHENLEYIRKELLFISLQYHLGVDYTDSLSYNFDSESPIPVEQLLCVHNIPRHFFYDICLSKNNIFNNKYQEPSIFIRDHCFNKSIKILNNQISILQTLFGQQNHLVHHKLIQLCYSSLYNNDIKVSEMCFNSLSTRSSSPVFAMSSLFLIYKSLENNNIEDFHNVISTNSNIFKYYYGKNSDKELEYYIQILKLLNKFNRISLFNETNDYITKNFETKNPHQQFELLIEQCISLIQQNKFTICYQQLEKAKDYVIDTFGKSSFQYCKYCYEMSNSLISLGTYDEALSYSMNSYANIWYKNRERFLFQIIEQIAFIYYQLKDYKNSIKFYESLFQYYQQNEKERFLIIQIIIQEYFKLLNEDVQGKSIITKIQAHKESNKTAQKKLLERIVSKIDILKTLFSNLNENSFDSNLCCLYQIAKYEKDSLFDLIN